MVARREARRRRGDFAVLSSEQRWQLLNGRPLFESEQMPVEDMQMAWEVHRDELKAEWKATRGPGRRCFAEWLFEIVPQYGERPTTPYFDENHAQHREALLKHGLLHTHTWPPMQEPEAEYPFRNGVIDEAEYLAACELEDQ